MPNGPRLFISFSSADQQVVRKLFSSLQVQNVDYWDYSEPGRELPLGSGLGASLAEKIDLCEFFVAVVSANSADAETGRNTRAEVARAIERGMVQRQRVLPVLLLANPPGRWAGPYEQLQHVLRVDLDPSDDERFEEAVRRICARLAVPYVPPLLKDTRVFFARRFLEEADALGLSLSNSEFVHLMRVIHCCAGEVLDGRWGDARKSISSFLTLCDVLSPGAQFHYPLIIRGVCELQLGEYDAAEATFREATRRPSNHSRSGAGLGFAGLGHTYYQQRKYAEAAAAFQRAMELIPDDADLEFNLLGTLLEAGGRALDDTLLEKFDVSALPPEARFKVIKMKGVVYYKQGKFQAAAAAFRSLDPSLLDDAAAVYYAQTLRQCGQEEAAIRVLRSAAARLDDDNLYHHLAYAYLEAGYVREGLEVYESRLCQPGRWRRQYLIEYARVMSSYGPTRERWKASAACEKVLDLKIFSHAADAEDFFYMGFANYLLGRHALAESDYARSAGFCEKYYDEIEL